MKLEIARLARRCSRLSVAWLSIVWSSTALAQSAAPPVPSPNPETVAATSAPGVAARREMTVEERLQKLEAMNQQLLQQNQQLNREMKTVSRKVEAPQLAVAQPPAGGANVLRAEPSTGSAYGGSALMAPSTGSAFAGFGGSGLLGPTGGITRGDIGARGPGANVIGAEPSTAGAQGGSDLLGFDEAELDTKGLDARAFFGRKFINNGFWISSPNRNFQFHVGGQATWDTTGFDAGNTVQFGPRGIGKLRDGTDPRFLRFRFEGAMYENFLWQWEVDFAQSGILINNGVTGPTGPLTGTINTPAALIPTPCDVWVGERNVPIIGNIRIGNLKEPFGFERLVSSRFLSFMERSYNTDAFYQKATNGYVPGVLIFGTALDLHMTLSGGVFKVSTNPYDFQIGGGGWAETGRITVLPLYEDEGRKVMHLGMTLRDAGYDNGTDQFRVRGPERSGLSPTWLNYANTGAFHARGGNQDINLESVNVFGPWSIVGEYDFHFDQNAFLGGANGTRQTNVGTLFYSGGYVEILRFLTGEHRAYVRESGTFDRVIPRQDAYWTKGKDGKPNTSGIGAWQLGLRYNYLNLNNKGINGGVLNDITLGLNWFLNPNMKMQISYSITNRHSPASPGQPIGLSDGTIQGLGLRVAMDF
ncbi:MAG: porin [Isosphaeraceae bacterium]